MNVTCSIGNLHMMLHVEIADRQCQPHTTYSQLGPIPAKRPRLKPQLITGFTLGCRVPAPERTQHPGYAYENPLNGIFSFRPMPPLSCFPLSSTTTS